MSSPTWVKAHKSGTNGGSCVQLRRNGVAIAQSPESAGMIPSALLHLGARNGALMAANCHIARLRIYTGALSVAGLSAIEQELGSIYGITIAS